MGQKLEQSLRSTLNNFKLAGHLHFIEQEIDPRYELGALLLLQDRDPSLFFCKVKGYRIPIGGNLLNSRNKIALGLGVERKHLQAICMKALDCGIPPEIVAKGPIKTIKGQKVILKIIINRSINQ
jgi:UbiD family decarboxylase